MIHLNFSVPQHVQIHNISESFFILNNILDMIA